MADWSDSAPVAEGVLCPFGHEAPVRRLVDTIWEAPEGSAEYRCSECDIVFLHPIMSPEEEREFYEGKFAEYMAKRGQAGGADPRDSFEKWRPEGARRLELLRPWLREGMRVLEFGAATGFLLDAVRPFVGEVVGIEPGDDFRGFAESELGIEMHRHRDEVTGRRFDLILSYYVVEHLRDPVGELTAWRELLNSGGHLAIEVPNVDDALVKYWQVEAFDRFYWQTAHYFNYSHAPGDGAEDRRLRRGRDHSRAALRHLQPHPLAVEGEAGRRGRVHRPARRRCQRRVPPRLREHWHATRSMAVARRPG